MDGIGALILKKGRAGVQQGLPPLHIGGKGGQIGGGGQGIGEHPAVRRAGGQLGQQGAQILSRHHIRRLEHAAFPGGTQSFFQRLGYGGGLRPNSGTVVDKGHLVGCKGPGGKVHLRVKQGGVLRPQRPEIRRKLLPQGRRPAGIPVKGLGDVLSRPDAVHIVPHGE